VSDRIALVVGAGGVLGSALCEEFALATTLGRMARTRVG
jgi:NAD(P)-dependent dehydrogenase (short-subunit alcohol dehydrogenase family)